MAKKEITFPINPLSEAIKTEEIQRRTVAGILESYNSNYDVLAEMVQNAVDTVEDAYFTDLPQPYLMEVHINLQKNEISVLDTGIGMSREKAVNAFVPHVTFKANPVFGSKRGKNRYRGYKGVGLTFLAYGTDDITLHTKTHDGEITKGRMQYGRAWAMEERTEPALVVEDKELSPLDKYTHGTFVKIQLSNKTRPKKLSAISSSIEGWTTVLRTRTAIGQIRFSHNPLLALDISLTLTDANGIESKTKVDSIFLFPHLVKRVPSFRFLDLPKYLSENAERTDIPSNYSRQDGIYLTWDKDKIYEELTKEQKEKYKDEIEKYNPKLYAFFPYSSSIWESINGGRKIKWHLPPGVIIGVNRQRLADTVETKFTRYTHLSPSLFVLVHFDNAKPDQGRKTLQDEVMGLAKGSADRVLQYLMKHQSFLKPRGDAPTAEQRENEKNHEDWKFNVMTHTKNNPLSIAPLTYKSEPLEEQDVVGLFHQLSVCGVFPGIQVFATSQIKTYDSLVKFDCLVETKGLKYYDIDNNPLGVSHFILGESNSFSTKYLTLEFKNTLDALINELVGKVETKKEFTHIDICVCWRVLAKEPAGFTLEEITGDTVEERRYPGVTHLLRKDGDSHVIQVIMLSNVIEMIRTGRISINETE